MRAGKTAGLCGVAGPILFVSVLSFTERDFMASLGWALAAPTRDWPSGLALGPGGIVMTLTFLLCGALLVVFALGLQRTFRPGHAGKAATLLLVTAGCAMCFLSFATDPTNSSAPATVHGRIHDAAFAVLGAALLSSLACSALFSRAFRKRAWRFSRGWQRHSPSLPSL